MRFTDYYNQANPAISFELFPPKTKKAENDLEANLPRLIDLSPDFFTVTYGALGTTRDGTLKLASKLKIDYNVEVAHHLTCVALNKDQLDTALAEIKSIVADAGEPTGSWEVSLKTGTQGFSSSSDSTYFKAFQDSMDSNVFKDYGFYVFYGLMILRCLLILLSLRI